MQTCNEILKQTEDKDGLATESVARTILLELERILYIHFPLEIYHVNATVFLQMLLFAPASKEYHPVLFRLLEKYNVNEKNIVARFLYIIHQINLPEMERNRIESIFASFPFCKKIKFLKNASIIETKDGAIIEAYKLSEVFHNKELCKLLYTYNFKAACHEAVEKCSAVLKSDSIITSEIPRLFKGIYYHSYFKTNYGKDVIDVSNNILYKNNTFDTFFEPLELQQILSSSLKDAYNQLPKCEQDKKICKVLRLALLNKMKES